MNHFCHQTALSARVATSVTRLRIWGPPKVPKPIWVFAFGFGGR